jgi:predicted transcriptional regulator of viral defense system
MWIKNFASRLLRDFAEDRRRVISEWRILIAARRAAYAENAPLPDEKKASEIRKELMRRGDIKAVKGIEGVFIIDVPFANLLEVSEEQLVQEANPWAVFGFLTALLHHGLTDLPPKKVYAIQFKDGEHRNRTPLGTTPDDWADLRPPSPRQPQKIGETEVVWTEIQKKLEFGIEVGYSSGLPVYVTDRERTLLDALRMPDKCGGIAKVLHAWRYADNLDISQLTEYADLLDIQNLRQRVGYILERLGHAHPALERWRQGLKRGGSIRLVASEPYSETYSPEWNLSLNVPPSVLAIMD